MVVAEPGPLPVDREDERARVLELEQDPLRSGGSEEPIGQRSVHALEDRRSQHELADRLGLALQDLGEQVVGHGPLAARELGDEALRVGTTGQRERRQPEPGGPSLGARRERGDGVVGELDPSRGKELARLVERELQIGGPYLRQLAGEAVAMQSDRRIVAGRQDHPELRRPAGEQLLELRQRVRGEQLVQVVDHEHDGLLERAQPRDEAFEDGCAIESGRRGQLLDGPMLSGSAPQRIDDREPEALRVVLVALDRHERRPLAQAGGIEPRLEQDRLAAAGGRTRPA